MDLPYVSEGGWKKWGLSIHMHSREDQKGASPSVGELEMVLVFVLTAQPCNAQSEDRGLPGSTRDPSEVISAWSQFVSPAAVCSM